MPPPEIIPTDLVRVETPTLDVMSPISTGDGLLTPGLGLSPVSTGFDALIASSDSFVSTDPAPFDFSASGVSSPGIFRSPGDFMTGGNRTHNAAIDQMVTREAVRILGEERGMSVDEAEVRRFVHDELRHYKVNANGQRNGNVDHSDFAEILDHTVAHFGGVERRVAPTVLESNEDVHWRIEEMIEKEFLKPENAETWSGMSMDRFEILRSTLRTRLRAEFANVMMNEVYTERLEDVSEFFQPSVVRKFEESAESVIAGAIGEFMVCTVEAPVSGTRLVTDAVTPAVSGTRVVTDTAALPVVDTPDTALRTQLEAEIRRQVPVLDHSNFDTAVRGMAEWIINTRTQNGETVTFGADGHALFPVETYVARYEADYQRMSPANGGGSVDGVRAEDRDGREESHPERDVRRMAERGMP